jgi:hypothetical protein
LSERQMQFWEDVEDGLDDMADFFNAKQLQQPNSNHKNIDRIRTFAKRYVTKKIIFLQSS